MGGGIEFKKASLLFAEKFCISSRGVIDTTFTEQTDFAQFQAGGA
jgi:hypothetical protein